MSALAIVLAVVPFSLVALVIWRWWRRSTPKGSTDVDTEFTAEVVRITEVFHHPNADKLEIAKFELAGSGPSAYECVIQKGSFRPGDLAGYFSVDCIVPTAHPDFAFLTQRPDGQGKTHFRLRAARLRGVFSQGLLVPVADRCFGDKLAEDYGVTYHRAPDQEAPPGQPGQTRKNPQPMPCYSVASLRKLPRLFSEHDDVVVTEKIHGCNMRFGWVRRKLAGIPIGWKFVVGSHYAIKGDGRSGYYGEDVWTQTAEDLDLAAKTREHKGLVFFGELYGVARSGQQLQDLTYSRTAETGPGLAIFDVQRNGGGWLPPAERLELVQGLGLENAPVLYVGPFDPVKVCRLAEGVSVLDGGYTLREGVVVENLEGQRRKAKYVGEGYLTRKEAPAKAVKPERVKTSVPLAITPAYATA